MCNLFTAFQVIFDFCQIMGYTRGIGSFRQFVFHIELIVDHIGKESLTHVSVAENRKGQQADHVKYETPAMGKAEP